MITIIPARVAAGRRVARTPSIQPAAARHLPVMTGASLCLAALSAWALIFAGPLSAISHHRSQSELYAGFRHELVRETAPLGGAIRPGTAVAVISAPQANLENEVVVEGTSSGTLQEGPGHLRNTPLPGQAGVSVLFGRSVSYGGPFGGLGRLVRGDRITVTTQQGTFGYDVIGVRRAGDPLPTPPGTGEGRLVLVSSAGSGWRSGWAPSGQILVDATLVGKPVIAPGGLPTSVPAAELPMRGDVSAWPLVAFGLQALILAILAVLWLTARGHRRRAWLLGVPILLAGLWLVSDKAFVLLPNLL